MCIYIHTYKTGRRPIRRLGVEGTNICMHRSIDLSIELSIGQSIHRLSSLWACTTDPLRVDSGLDRGLTAIGGLMSDILNRSHLEDLKI